MWSRKKTARITPGCFLFVAGAELFNEREHRPAFPAGDAYGEKTEQRDDADAEPAEQPDEQCRSDNQRNQYVFHADFPFLSISI